MNNNILLTHLNDKQFHLYLNKKDWKIKNSQKKLFNSENVGNRYIKINNTHKNICPNCTKKFNNKKKQ
jgi:hypothetical protein